MLIYMDPNAVREIGIFDERFSGLLSQEYDFFMRMVLYVGNRVCMHDYVHRRTNRPLLGGCDKSKCYGHREIGKWILQEFSTGYMRDVQDATSMSSAMMKDGS